MKALFLILFLLLVLPCSIQAEPFVPIGGNTDLEDLAMEINRDIDSPHGQGGNGKSFFSEAIGFFIELQDKRNELTANIVQLLYPFGDIEPGDVKMNF